MERTIRPVLALLVLVIFTLPLVLAQRGDRELAVVIGKAESAKSELRYAHMKHFDEEDFQGALSAYQAVVTRFPESPEAAEAQFRRANVFHWNLTQPEQAIHEYQKVIDNYPDTDYAIEAMIRMGECYARLKQFDRTLEHCQRVIDQYPDSRYVPQAMLTKANTLLFDKHERVQASELYATIVERFPDTKYAQESRLWLTYQQTPEQLPETEKMAVYRDIHKQADDYQVQATAQYMIAFSCCVCQS